MILGRQSGLGRGLGALIPQKPGGANVQARPMNPPAAPQPMQPTSYPTMPGEPAMQTPASPVASQEPQDNGRRILNIEIEKIQKNPQQPRLFFDHAQLEDLIASIKEHGVIQPIVVTRGTDGMYELIAGERRLRASTIAGLKTIPAIVREAGEQEKLELALIENIQRQDLNPIEEGKAYIRLTEEFHLTQDEISKKVGKSRPQVANIMRLLQLPEEIQKALMEGRISLSNGRTLLSLPTDEERMKLFQAMLAGNFTVRETEARVPRQQRLHRGPADPNIAAVEDQIRTSLHCKVQIKRNPKGQGEVRLKFFSDEELRALIEKLRS